MSEVTVKANQPAMGLPDGATVTVERTDRVDGAIRAGILTVVGGLDERRTAYGVDDEQARLDANPDAVEAIRQGHAEESDPIVIDLPADVDDDPKPSRRKRTT